MRYALLAILALCAANLQALDVGEPAPSLATVTWVKNGPVEVGRSLTVVEFWATWCGPCRASIPKLTSLSAKYHDRLIVVGLSDEDLPTIKPFVAAQGEHMNYQVGMVNEAVHEGYMAGRDGIPYAFLVGADGKVIWHGHPLALEKIVAAVIAGTWDPKSEAKRAARSQELQELLSTDPAGDEDGLLKRIQDKTAAILAEDPLDSEAFDIRLGVAKHMKNGALIRAALEALPIDQLDAERAAELAERLVKDENPADRHLDLAYGFAARAVAADPTAASAHAAQATVWHALGMVDRAVASQQRAVAVDPADDVQLTRLAFYREAQRIAALITADKPLTAPPAAASKSAATSGAAPAPRPSPAGPASLVP